ncbi:MAG: Na/Pi cotransporter family protein [Parasporobacterium sp.]|nr:Na/Pi cotransporter family protein [Parasporobacterium sp.]
MTFEEILFFVVKLFAGIGVFLVGVHLLTKSIEQLATKKIRDLFGKTAGKKLVNVGIGAATTALIQSSGVTTVLIVGFVNIGIIDLAQATTMIMGSNIGTTITAQIAALSTFPITTYIQILAGIGMLITTICKKEKTKQIGFILAGFGLIFIGLSVMSDAMKTNSDAIQVIFENITNPFLLFLIGILLTALVQSSSVISSVVIAMSVAGLVIGTGGNEILFIILGTNIGSCVTAVMSAMGSGSNAKRAAIIHLMFNVFGSVIFMILLLAYPGFMKDTFGKWFAASATQIAMFHTFFNVVCTIIFLPFTNVFVKISQLIIRDKEVKLEYVYLDERILLQPELAIKQLRKEMMVMADMAMDTFDTAYKAMREKDMDLAKHVEPKIGACQDKSKQILDYLIKVSANISGVEPEKDVVTIHNNIGDLMRVAEIGDNFAKYTILVVENQIVFSDHAMVEMDEMVNQVHTLLNNTKKYIIDENESMLSEVDRAEEQVDVMRKRLVDEHITRLNEGRCQPESSSIFINMVSNIERMGDHIFYVAHAEVDNE